MRKIFLPIRDQETEEMWEEFGDKIVSNWREANIFQFIGGEDVTPRLYHRAAHPKTQFNMIRDARDYKYWCLAKQTKTMCVGICRGSQFLWAMAGGTLFQHCVGHPYIHEVKDVVTGEIFKVTSTHHQQASTYDINPSLMANVNIRWVAQVNNVHKEYVSKSGGIVKIHYDDRANCIEGWVVKNDNNILVGCQGHPEYPTPDALGVDTEFRKKFFELVNDGYNMRDK